MNLSVLPPTLVLPMVLPFSSSTYNHIQSLDKHPGPTDYTSSHKWQNITSQNLNKGVQFIPKVKPSVIKQNYPHIISLNVRSIKNKCEEVELFLDEQSPDIFCMSEHWLSDIEATTFAIPSYVNSNIYCRNSPYGGVAVLSKPHLNVSPIPEIHKYCIEKTFECTGITFIVSNKSFIILSIYRSPSSDVATFVCKFDKLLIRLTKLYPKAEMIICGDFNIDFLQPSKERTLLQDIIGFFNLSITISTPTRITPTSSTLLDNIFTTLDHNSLKTKTIDPGLSDHHAISLQLLAIPNVKITTLYKRNYSDENVSNFVSLLQEELWSSSYTETNVDDCFGAFHSRYVALFNVAFPLTKYRINNKPKSKKWVTPEVRLSSADLHHMHSACKRNPNIPELKAAYNVKKKIHSRKVKATKRLFHSQIISNSKNKSKTTWSIIKSETSSLKPATDITLSINGKTITNPKQIADEFNTFFTESSYLPPPSSSPISSCQTNHSIFVSPTTPIEVEHTIKGISPKYSCGFDDIPSAIIVKTAKLISEPLCHIINMSLEQGTFPSVLKKSIVIPIHKKGDKHIPNNYRPISLLSSFSKIFELIMQSRITSYFTEFDILDNCQHGFRSKRSTTTAIFSFLSSLYLALDKGDSAIGLFVDLSKAFDTIDHKILLAKLTSLGINGPALGWIESFLSDRTQVVKIKGATSSVPVLSNPQNVQNGVPQGSVLGPLFFIVYINDLRQFLHNNNTIPICVKALLTLYADDINSLLTSSKETTLQLTKAANCQVSQMLSYSTNNRLAIQTTKTFFLNFRTGPRQVLSSPLIRLEGHSIPRVVTTKVLGLTISDSLDWAPHIQSIVPRLLSGCFMLRKLKLIVNPPILSMVYHAFIHSLLSYGIIFWGTSPHAKRIFIIQKRAVRIIAGISRRQSCKAHFTNLRILTLTCTLIISAATFVYSNPDHFPLNNAHHSHFTRYNTNIFIPKSSHTFFDKSPTHVCSTIFNKLPALIKYSNSLTLFKHKLKDFLLNKAYYSLREFLDDH